MDQSSLTNCLALKTVLLDVFDTIRMFGRVPGATDPKQINEFRADVEHLIRLISEAVTFHQLGSLATYAHRSCLVRGVVCGDICLPHLECLMAVVFLQSVDLLHTVPWRLIEKRRKNAVWLRDVVKAAPFA